jgi:hypothetical protein
MPLWLLWWSTLQMVRPAFSGLRVHFCGSLRVWPALRCGLTAASMRWASARREPDSARGRPTLVPRFLAAFMPATVRSRSTARARTERRHPARGKASCQPPSSCRCVPVKDRSATSRATRPPQADPAGCAEPIELPDNGRIAADEFVNRALQARSRSRCTRDRILVDDGTPGRAELRPSRGRGPRYGSCRLRASSSAGLLSRAPLVRFEPVARRSPETQLRLWP